MEDLKDQLSETFFIDYPIIRYLLGQMRLQVEAAQVMMTHAGIEQLNGLQIHLTQALNFAHLLMGEIMTSDLDEKDKAFLSHLAIAVNQLNFSPLQTLHHKINMAVAMLEETLS